MEPATDGRSSLNESHRRRLISNFEYADKLLSEIEHILTASASKSPFPKYVQDTTPAQARVIEDYLARIRAQMIRLLPALGVGRTGPVFGAIHSIRVNLAFVRIAVQESAPKYLAGYGEVPAEMIPELDGVTAELESLVNQLDSFLAQGPGSDLAKRLARLEAAGDDVELLRKLEAVVSGHGLVEFRPTLAMIIDRLSGNQFEVAVFGQVSSGKSSLLNHVIGEDLLPVGVNPITSVPTRIVWGEAPRLTVTFTDQKVKRFGVERLPEFVTEELNPSNEKGVVRVVVEVRSARLGSGVVFIDTPGLGSLATAGAAETRAYLPQCDLGVVLINSGAALTQEDVSTAQALYTAGIPAVILLSKADLLGPEDLERSLRYARERLSSELGTSLAVHPVSVVKEREQLLEQWFTSEVEPMYQNHQALARASMRRKIGLLRESVEAALNAKLRSATDFSGERTARWEEAERGLRRVAGRLPEAWKECLALTDAVRELGPAAMEWAARQLVRAWRSGNRMAPDDIVQTAIVEVAARGAGDLYSTLERLATELAEGLKAAGSELEMAPPPESDDGRSHLREMPQADSRAVQVKMSRPVAMYFGQRLAERAVRRKLRALAGEQVTAVFVQYGRALESWVRRALGEMESAFHSQAGTYRAQLERLLTATRSAPEERERLRRDLEAIGRDGRAK